MRNISIWLLSHKKTIYSVLGLPILCILFYQIIDKFIFQIYHISWSRIHLIIMPFVELLLMFFLFDNYSRTRKNGPLYIMFFSLFNLNIIYIFTDYYQPISGLNIPSIELVLMVALLAKTIFIITILISSLMSFERLNKVLQEFSSNESRVIISRLASFTILLLFFILGLAIRLYNLSGFPPYFDEYYHTSQAVHLLNKGSIEYSRAFIFVTLPVYLSFKIFGISLWVGRLVIVLINMLSIFPLYQLGKKVNQVVGFISVALFVFSPFIIATARTIRDYAIVPLAFYTIVILLTRLLEWEGLNFVQYLSRHKYNLFFVILILGYVIFDDRSVLKISLSLYGIFCLIALIKSINQGASLQQKIFILTIGVTVGSFILVYAGIFKRFKDFNLIVYQQAGSYWDVIFNSSVHQWYTTGIWAYFILFVVSALALRTFFLSYKKVNIVFIFSFLAFISHMIYLMFFLVSPRISERLRYGVLMEYWYLPLVAVTIWVIFNLFVKLFDKSHQIFLILLLVGFFSNPTSIASVITYQGGRYLEVTGNRHYVLEPAYQILQSELTEQDILITDVLNLYDEINGQKFNPNSIFKYREVNILNTIDQYPRGWIALSVIALPEKHGLAYKSFKYNDKQVQYIGLIGEVNLWQWGN